MSIVSFLWVIDKPDATERLYHQSANSLDPDQALLNIKTDLGQTCLRKD